MDMVAAFQSPPMKKRRPYIPAMRNERRVYAYYDRYPGGTLMQGAKALGLSESTVKKYRKMWFENGGEERGVSRKRAALVGERWLCLSDAARELRMPYASFYRLVLRYDLEVRTSRRDGRLRLVNVEAVRCVLNGVE